MELFYSTEMASNVGMTPFTEEMKSLGYEGQPLDLFGFLVDDEAKIVEPEGDNLEGNMEYDPIIADILATLKNIYEDEKKEDEKKEDDDEKKEDKLGDFLVPYGYEAPIISRNLFYNKHQSERRAAKRAAKNEVHKTTKKDWKKTSVKSVKSSKESDESDESDYEMFKKMAVARRSRKRTVV